VVKYHGLGHRYLLPLGLLIRPLLNGGTLGAPRMDHEHRSLKNAWKAQQRSAARDRLPLPDPQLHALFQFVDVAVARDGCDHSHRATIGWLQRNQIDPAPVIDWLRHTGGHCDCEVIANSVDEWEQSRDPDEASASLDRFATPRRTDGCG
jgi:hypothetical protein